MWKKTNIKTQFKNQQRAILHLITGGFKNLRAPKLKIPIYIPLRLQNTTTAGTLEVELDKHWQSLFKAIRVWRRKKY